MNSKTKEIAGDERVHSVVLKDDSQRPADLVVITTGVRPKSDITHNAGLNVHGGIVVNHYIPVSNENSYAAGGKRLYRKEKRGLIAIARKSNGR
ncbi:MAG: FAD-dependent oxidoreductase [Phycisphaerae bacterium]|nr:FAD-dependent oxidoreductase [Phycisphaerae bacterium]